MFFVWDCKFIFYIYLNYVDNYVDNFLLARDSRAFRNHVLKTNPDVDLTYITDDEKEIQIPITVNFFWPDL